MSTHITLADTTFSSPFPLLTVSVDVLAPYGPEVWRRPLSDLLDKGACATVVIAHIIVIVVVAVEHLLKSGVALLRGRELPGLPLPGLVPGPDLGRNVSRVGQKRVGVIKAPFRRSSPNAREVWPVH
ncbi:hypothetical protein C7999DRAFT_33911 [Corynascus novoguineensis]|uniref:Uncharacterized protein n=1 Tax=Corynascus novoguineensis TaxID=1126955 RepID=A0AAN7CQ02_9PEZI|nr:hypothetical protein C7999DRAFT_33911 [Corynascus novoguineensis]